MKNIFVFLFLLIVVSSCSAQSNDTSRIRIKRFDNELYTYLKKAAGSTESNNSLNDKLIADNSLFLDIFGKEVLAIGGIDSIGFFDRLNSFFSEPTLMGLYSDEYTKFTNIDLIETELSRGFDVLLTEFSEIKQPQLYMHVSGLNQNIIVTDELLSISADKYLGTDYPLYQQFFYDYEREQMNPDRIVPDYFLGFLMANYPFEGNEDVLLDCMIYEGKIRYVLSRLLPDRQIWEYVGYSKDQYLWCSNNQERIWKSILGNQHLFSPDYLVTSKYLKPAPYTAFLPTESPGRVGIWVGYQIVISYMKNHPQLSLKELMALTDYQQFLKDAKYKP